MWSNQATDFLVFPPGAVAPNARLIIGRDPATGLSGIFAYNNNNQLVFSLTSTSTSNIGFVPVASAPNQQGNIYWLDSPAWDTSGAIFENTIGQLILSSANHSANDDHAFLILAPGDGANGHGFTLGTQYDTTIHPYDLDISGSNYSAGLSAALHNQIRFGVKASHPETSFQFGISGTSGRSYNEEVTASGIVCASGASAAAGLVASHLNSDYGSAFNLVTGVWTCPESSYYDFSFVTNFTVAMAAATRTGLNITDTTTGLELAHNPTTMPANDASMAIATTAYCTKNDTVTFQITQLSGGNKTTGTSSRITIARRL